MTRIEWLRCACGGAACAESIATTARRGTVGSCRPSEPLCACRSSQTPSDQRRIPASQPDCSRSVRPASTRRGERRGAPPIALIRSRTALVAAHWPSGRTGQPLRRPSPTSSTDRPSASRHTAHCSPAAPLSPLHGRRVREAPRPICGPVSAVWSLAETVSGRRPSVQSGCVSDRRLFHDHSQICVARRFLAATHSSHISPLVTSASACSLPRAGLDRPFIRHSPARSLSCPLQRVGWSLSVVTAAAARLCDCHSLRSGAVADLSCSPNTLT